MWKKIIALVPLVVFTAGSAVGQDKSNDLAIVVNPGCSLENITGADLAKIFKLEKTKTPEGAKFVIAVRETDSPERNTAMKVIYHMTDADYERLCVLSVFAGKIQTAPKQLPNNSAVRQFVATVPGAISYLRASEADSTVKILKVDGISPGEAGYPIKIK